MRDHDSGTGTRLSRRVVLKGGATVALTALLPVQLRSAHAATPMPRFLDESELETLRAVVDRIIPADHEPGALAADCARFIDAFLGAFQTDPPFIYAGAAFSDRGGHPQNQFLEFVPLDAYEATAWRLVLEGSQGNPQLEFNGPVTGLQTIYREGLAQLDSRAREYGADSFAALPAPAQEMLLNDDSDGRIAALVDAAYLDTMNGMYGPPEYGGNQGLAGWQYTGFDGDVQPRGYTPEQVIHADNPGPFDATLPPSFSEGGKNDTPRRASRTGLISLQEAEAIAAGMPASQQVLPTMTSQEVMSSVIADAEGSLKKLRAILKPYVDSLPGGN